MQRHSPDTCYCVYDSERPSLEGKYIVRCSIHANSRDTRDCYQYNIDNQERAEPDEDKREQKKRVTKELTRP